MPRKVEIVAVRGLHKKNGVWAAFRGGLKARIYFDPLVDISKEGSGVFAHEAAHAWGRHDHIGLVLLFLFPPAYLWWRRHAETLADRFVVRHRGVDAYLAMVYAQRQPTSWWGRWCYGRTVEERIARCMKNV